MNPKLRVAVSTGVVLSSVAIPLLARRPRLLRFVAVTSTAATTGLSMAHALERPSKLQLPIEEWWRLTDQLYRPWFGYAGHAEGVCLVALPLLAATDRQTRRQALEAWLLVLVANPGIFMAMVAPANRATLESPRTPTADAEQLRARWELGHLMRFGCHLLAFLMLAWENARAGTRE